MTLVPLAALLFVTGAGIYAAARLRAAAWHAAARNRRNRNERP